MKDGDLWKKFQEAFVSKGPWAVWVTKVKWHATDEDVEQGNWEEAEIDEATRQTQCYKCQGLGDMAVNSAKLSTNKGKGSKGNKGKNGKGKGAQSQ